MSLGKKILSAFVEVDEDKESEKQSNKPIDRSHAQPIDRSHTQPIPTIQNVAGVSAEDVQKFKNYFSNLLNESKSTGPDYLAFTKMVDAMSVIADEKTRYIAAFAGIAAQGLSKTNLMASADKIMEVLEQDCYHFNNTISAALQEKVQDKKQSVDEKTQKIQELSKEISDLNNQIGLLKQEIAENEEKINHNAAAYMNESSNLRNKIGQELEKIKQYLN